MYPEIFEVIHCHLVSEKVEQSILQHAAMAVAIEKSASRDCIWSLPRHVILDTGEDKVEASATNHDSRTARPSRIHRILQSGYEEKYGGLDDLR